MGFNKEVREWFKEAEKRIVLAIESSEINYSCVVCGGNLKSGDSHNELKCMFCGYNFRFNLNIDLKEGEDSGI